jgi:hypothetical protein
MPRQPHLPSDTGQTWVVGLSCEAMTIERDHGASAKTPSRTVRAGIPAPRDAQIGYCENRSFALEYSVYARRRGSVVEEERKQHKTAAALASPEIRDLVDGVFAGHGLRLSGAQAEAILAERRAYGVLTRDLAPFLSFEDEPCNFRTALTSRGGRGR